jgi:hypothetical protein
VSLLADDSPPDRAMLHSSGVVLLNQGSAPSSIAIFAGDEIETRPGSSGYIEYLGSMITISPETILRFESGEIVLDHGSVTVTSFRQFRVRAGCVLATPVAAENTTYVVRDTDNRVTVIAQQKDVKLESHSGSIKKTSQRELSDHTIVHEHEQKSREEHCGAADLRNPAVPGATGGILNSPYAVGTAAIIAGVITCWSLCRSDDPASPSSPSKSSTTANHR